MSIPLHVQIYYRNDAIFRGFFYRSLSGSFTLSSELKTRQEPLKIFNFYRHRLVDEGHLEEVE